MTATVIILAILLVGLAIAGISIKILVKKDGEFAGTCASNSPFLEKEGGSCGACGARPEEQCKRDPA